MTLFAGPLKTSHLYNYPVEVEGVIDGDTLDLKIDLGFKLSYRQRVRLYGIDTKEIFGPKREAAGQTSKQFSKDWVEASTEPFRLSMKKYDDREKYGRMLGVLYRGDDPVSLNDALINAGLARPSPASWGMRDFDEV